MPNSPEIEVLPPETDEVDPLLDELSQWMDTKFSIPGTPIRFGIDPLLGLIPGLGDTLSMLISFYILSHASRYGVPRVTLARMGTNVLIDCVLGSVPIVGDLFDVAWKANTRNIELLRRALAVSPQEQRRARRGDWWFVLGMIALLCAALGLSIFAAWQILYFLGAAASHWTK